MRQADVGDYLILIGQSTTTDWALATPDCPGYDYLGYTRYPKTLVECDKIIKEPDRQTIRFQSNTGGGVDVQSGLRFLSNRSMTHNSGRDCTWIGIHPYIVPR